MVVSQDYQIIDVRKFFTEKFQLIDAEGMTECYSFAAPTEIVDLGQEISVLALLTFWAR